MRIGVFVAIASGANADYIRRHSIVGPAPEPVVFHGLLGLDMDALKPPQTMGPAFDKFREDVTEAEQKQHEHIMAEYDAVKKVEQEFLQSDLHKAAVHGKLLHIIE